MKKYEYVTLNYEGKDMFLTLIKDHKKVIEDYAKKGYDFITVIPTEMNYKGCYRQIDLVFSKTI